MRGAMQWFGSACLQACVVLAAVPATVTAAEPAGGEAGVWQEHKLDFQFMGFTTTYSCDGLGDTLRVLLQAAGANQGAKVNPLCALGSGRPDKLASATLKFESLQPLAPTESATATPVSGAWRHVQISWRKPRQLERGDCELVEEFADKVLPMFTTRHLERQITCIPHQDSGNRFDLGFDVFAPLEAPKGAGSVAPRQ